MAEETPVTYEELTGEPTKKHDKAKVVIGTEPIGSYGSTRSHGIRLDGGIRPLPGDDTVDLSHSIREPGFSFDANMAGFVIRHDKDKAESSHSRGKDKEEAAPRDRPQSSDRRYLTAEEVKSIWWQRPRAVRLPSKYEQRYNQRSTTNKSRRIANSFVSRVSTRPPHIRPPWTNRGWIGSLSRFTGQPESRSRLVFHVYVCALQETKRGIIHTFLTRYRSGGTPLRPSIGARPGGFAGRRSEGRASRSPSHSRLYRVGQSLPAGGFLTPTHSGTPGGTNLPRQSSTTTISPSTAEMAKDAIPSSSEVAEETPVTYEELTGELKKKYGEVKSALETDPIGSSHYTRSPGIGTNVVELGYHPGEGSDDGGCSHSKGEEGADPGGRTIPRAPPALPVFGVDLSGDGKLGFGFTSADELEEVDIGLGDKPRPTFISRKLDPQLRGQMIALLKEYPDCFAWDYTEMPGLDRSIIEHRLPLKKGFRPFQQRARQMKAEILEEVKKEIEKMLAAGPYRHAGPAWISHRSKKRRPVASGYRFPRP
ncbi:hypothetical protein QYE76_067051 [Lolium multiflorum]|uniref:Uncharacterized protein n=1 Tax=Lolium multiflorum TaxID=4521 RepID=A0AAD8WAD8_LOLMU|nr:hypothetical protein QYE76_067051 [Lolium multiflorum]